MVALISLFLCDVRLMIKQLRALLVLPVFIYAQSHYEEVLVDPHASPFMGSEWILTLHKSLEVREDAILPPPPKRGFFPGLGRMAELGLFWGPLNIFADTVQHEVFGHGYRVRTLSDAKVVKYSFGWPPPYGAGGGSTSWASSTCVTIGQLQAVNIAGLEAENILARELKLKWIAEGAIEPRSSFLYNFAKLSPVIYSFSQPSYDIDELPVFQSHDIVAYLNTLDVLYPHDFLSLKALREAVLYNLLDPMLYYNIGAEWYYIFTGKKLKIPMIHIGKLAWLPNISVQLAPYGLEYYLENYFLYKEAPFYTYIKGGAYSGMEYFGTGLRYDEMFSHENFSVGIRIDGWYQPNFLVDWTLEELSDHVRPLSSIVSSMTCKWGVAASLVSRWRIRDTLTFFYSDLGYKTKGYLPGFSLQSSPVIRAGLSAEF